MFFVFFALWVVLNGKWTTEIGVLGLVFAAVIYAFSCRFLGYSLKKDAALLRRAGAALRYGGVLLAEIFKANVAVIEMILDLRFEPQPQLIRFRSGLKKERHRVALADSITLTPGTITCQLEDDLFVVHCLDKSLAEGIDDSVFVKALEEMEEEK